MNIRLKAMLISSFEKDKGLQSELSNKFNYDRSSFHKFLHNESRQLSDINILVNVVDYFYPEIKNQLLNDYFLTISPATHFARQALEYSSFYNLPCLHELVQMLNDSSNRSSKELALIYKFHIEMRTANVNELEDIMDELYSTKVKQQQAIFFKEFCLIGICYKLHYYDFMDKRLSKAKACIKNMSDAFLKVSYDIRLIRIEAMHKLFESDIDTARRLCETIICLTNDPNILKSTYHTLGISYLFESYELGILNFEKAAQFHDFSKGDYTDLDSSINFHCLLWKKPIKLLGHNAVSKAHERTMYFLNKEDVVNAKRVIHSVSVGQLSKREKAFHFYLMGLVTNDLEHYLSSLMLFREMGDKFYLKLPILKLKEFGTEDSILKALCL